MRVVLFLVAVSFSAMADAQSVFTKDASPGSRNTRVVYYDNNFLFMARDNGDHRDFSGNTEPGFFVHSKAHDRWLQILQVSTTDGKFGKSQSDDPEESKRLQTASVGWDFTSYVKKSSIDLPLKTSGSIAFPEKIELDATADRFQLSFFTTWKIESAATRLYVSRKDLTEQFDKLSKP